jgi:hypothetical protein
MHVFGQKLPVDLTYTKETTFEVKWDEDLTSRDSVVYTVTGLADCERTKKRTWNRSKGIKYCPE